MNGTVAAITTRALLGRRRFAVLLPLPLLLVGLAALAHSLEPNPVDWVSRSSSASDSARCCR